MYTHIYIINKIFLNQLIKKILSLKYFQHFKTIRFSNSIIIINFQKNIIYQQNNYKFSKENYV